MWETVLRISSLRTTTLGRCGESLDFHVTVWMWDPTTKQAKGHAPQGAWSVILYVTRLYQANDKGELFEDTEFRPCSDCFNIKVWGEDLQITVLTLQVCLVSEF